MYEVNLTCYLVINLVCCLILECQCKSLICLRLEIEIYQIRFNLILKTLRHYN
jgi:hypothetical protein